MSLRPKPQQLGQREVDTFSIRLLTIVATCSVVFVGPFAVYRYVAGYCVVAINNAVLILTAVVSAYVARKTGTVRIPGLVVSTVLSVATAVVTLEVGVGGAVWIFPVMLFVYYLCRHTIALLLIAGVLLTIAAAEWLNPGSIFASPVQMAGFLSAAAAATVFSSIFSSQNLWQQKRLMQWATIDPLTGLGNRRSLEHELAVAAAAERRHGLCQGLLIIDLDNFKALNDTYGHFACDKVLVDFASLLRSCTRIEDRVFRFGGDEFVIIIPNTELAGIERVATSILESIPEFFSNRPFRITASIGGGSLQAHEPVDEWKERVDRCLYSSKAQGRNRYVSDGYPCS